MERTFKYEIRLRLPETFNDFEAIDRALFILLGSLMRLIGVPSAQADMHFKLTEVDDDKRF